MEHDMRVDRGAEVIANPLIRTHPVLRFEHPTVSPAEQARYLNRLRANIDQEIIASEVLDWGTMDAVVDPDTHETGAQYLHRMLSVDYMLEDGSIGFTSLAWERLFSIREVIFKELVLEFYSTLRFDVSSDDCLQHTLYFMLGGEPRQLDVVRFARAIGLYTAEDVDHPHFWDFLRAARVEDYSDIEVAAGWTDIANGEFGGRGPSDVHVRRPSLKLIHRLLAHSICARKTGHEKVHRVDLLFLHSISQGTSVNVPWRLANWMVHKGTGTKASSVICGGQYVTRLARWFGFTEDMFQTFSTVHPGMQLMGATKLQELSVIRRPIDGDFYIWTPPLGAGDRRVRRRRDAPPQADIAHDQEHAEVPPQPQVYQGPVFDMYQMQREMGRMFDYQQQHFEQIHRYHEEERRIQEQRYQVQEQRYREQQYYQREQQRFVDYSSRMWNDLFEYHRLPHQPYVPSEFGGPSGVHRDGDGDDSE